MYTSTSVMVSSPGAFGRKRGIDHVTAVPSIRTARDKCHRRKVVHIMASLPKRRQVEVQSAKKQKVKKSETESAQAFLVQIMSQEGYNTETVASMSTVPSCITPERVENYNHETIALVRSRNINQLRENYKTGQCTNPCNRFGESLLHMACRRGFTEVSFFVQEAQQDVRVRDDYGRTPLHDVCWSVEPNFDLLKLLIVQDPSLLLASDRRNHCPLDYVREEHWGAIKAFLTENKDVLFCGLPVENN
jgi:hypothetical protein